MQSGHVKCQGLTPRAQSEAGRLFKCFDETLEPAARLEACKTQAELGLTPSELGLGFMYYHGNEAPQDYAKALRWYRLAADQGLAQAQYNLSFMHGLGKGVPQDYVRGYMWLTLAASSGYEPARTTLDEVKVKMTRNQIVEAERMAREWLRASGSCWGTPPNG